MTTRSIDTDLWSDQRVVCLSYPSKLVFLRLIAGPETTAAGVIRITPEVVGAYLGMPPKVARASIDELLKAGLLREYDGWYWLPKFIQYQLSGPGFIVAIRRSMKGLPDALRVAIERALSNKVGPRKQKQDTDNEPTEKNANSRGSMGQTPRPTTRQTRVRPGSDREKYKDQDKEQDQNQPFGLVGSGTPTDDDEPDESAAATPAPEPGAQASPPGVDEPSESNGNGKRHRDEPLDLDTLAVSSPALRAALAAGRRKGKT